MTLMLPLFALFLFVGLTTRTMTKRIYMRIVMVIWLVALYYYLTNVL